MSDFTPFVNVGGAILDAGAEQVVVGEPFPDAAAAVLAARALDELVWPQGEAVPVNVVVEGAQAHVDGDTALEQHLAGGIEGKPVVEDKLVELVHEGTVAPDFEGRSLGVRVTVVHIGRPVRGIGLEQPPLRILVDDPPPFELPVYGGAMDAQARGNLACRHPLPVPCLD